MLPINICEVSDEQACRIGFMSGEISVPDDFDHIGPIQLRLSLQGKA